MSAHPFRPAPAKPTARAIRLALSLALAALALFLLPLALAARADAYVYWSNDITGAIGRANLDGTGVNQSFIGGIVPGNGFGPNDVAVNAGRTYWAHSGTNTIGRANLDGTGANDDFIPTAGPPAGVAVDSSHIYWVNQDQTNQGTGTIGRANLDGTGAIQDFITTANSSPGRLAVDASHIYWANQVTDTIGRANLDGTDVDQSFITGDRVVGVAVDAGHVYWTEGNLDTIARANLDGTDVDQSFITGPNFPLDVAVDAGHVYWTDRVHETIGRADLDGTDANLFFITSASAPTGVAVDSGPPANIAPTADAGPDQTVDSGANVGLDGAASTDPDAGDTLDYAWTQTGGPNVTLAGADTETPSFTAPTGPATLTFQLEVTDDDGSSDTDTVTVDVNEPPPVNQAPAADAGVDFTTDSGAIFILDGSGSSDPDGDALDYSWTQTSGPAVTLNGANTAVPSFVAPTGPATLVFELEVCDPEPLCDTDTMTVDVNEPPPVNQAPTADAGPDQTVASGAAVNLNGTGSSDPDGDSLDYSWTQTSGPAVTLSGANTATPSFTAPVGPATLVFQNEVCDPEPLCDTDSVTINVDEVPVGGTDVSAAVQPNGKTYVNDPQKTFFVKVRNLGTQNVTICPEDIDATVEVEGSPLGTVSAASACQLVKPTRAKKFSFEWSHGLLSPGDVVAYSGCVNVAGDENAANDCDSETRAARKAPV